MKKQETSFIKNILVHILIIIFFIGIVFVYYRMLYQETRENIISTGRNDAVASANRIDMYLSSSVDILKLSGYTVDNMIRENRSNKDILDYLTDETVAVRDSLIADTTGVYGYINGEYMDGSGWVPEEGYEPTKRPWYTEAREGNGELVMVDPYMDLDTGNLIIAITRILCDGESVVGIDLSMKEFQVLIEDHLSEQRFVEEFLINGNGSIVAHSDSSLVGTDYDADSNLLDKQIHEKINTSKDNFFFIEHDNKDYMVYIMPLSYDWNYITVIDATEDFNRLRIPLIITVLTAFIMVGMLSFFMGKSDKKSREARELAIKTERIMAANEAKTSFLSNMSHEIRTPINAILGMNEMISREAEKDIIKDYSDKIKNSGGLLLGLVDDIFDFSKLEAGELEINPAPYDLSVLINDLVNMISDSVEEKGLILNLDFDRNLPRYLEGDERRIKQIITNILTNAVKYTEKGSISFTIGFEQMVSSPDQIMLKVHVEDTGIGIKEEDLDKLFQRFERIEEKRNRSIAGTGLGMNITKSLLELMDSTLMVESTYGKGSTFGFLLNQKVVGEDKLGDYESFSKEYRGKSDQNKEILTAPDARILAVDDNPMNLMVLKNLLKHTLIAIDTAEDGYQAVERSCNGRYDLILLDHMMPGMDGIEALHEIRNKKDSLNKKTPAICLTANAIPGAREKYISEGFDDYMSKPVDSDKLENILLCYLPKDKIEMTSENNSKKYNVSSEQEKVSDKESGSVLRLLEGSMIDTAEGLKNCGSEDSYLSLVEMFNESMERSIEEIDGLYQDKDVKNYTIKIHALKSSARLIGTMELGELAQSLENAGKSGDEEYIRANHSTFIDEFRRAGEVIADFFEKINGPQDNVDDDTEKAEIDGEVLANYYGEIAVAADEIDSDRIDEILDELKGYHLSEEDKELVSRIKDAADGFDYDEISELLKNKV